MEVISRSSSINSCFSAPAAKAVELGSAPTAVNSSSSSSSSSSKDPTSASSLLALPAVSSFELYNDVEPHPHPLQGWEKRSNFRRRGAICDVDGSLELLMRLVTASVGATVLR